MIFKLLLLPFALLFVSYTSGHQFRVTNRCSQTIWVGTFGENQIPMNGGFKLNAGASQAFTVRDGWTAGRIWGKTGCNNNGRNCVTGESPPGGRTTLQAVTLAEFGLDKYMGLDFYDMSLVDGFNLPMAIRPNNVVNGDRCRELKCNFNFNVCPNQNNFREFAGGKMVACKSACSALKEPKYCCTPPYTEGVCTPSEYSKIFKQQCPDAFSYAYDTKTSDFACKGKGKSGYEVVFCP